MSLTCVFQQLMYFPVRYYYVFNDILFLAAIIYIKLGGPL